MDHVWLCSSKNSRRKWRKHHETWCNHWTDRTLNDLHQLPVTDFRAGRARFHISAEFFQKISFYQSWMTLKCFFSENRLPNRGAHYTWVNTVTEKVWAGYSVTSFSGVWSHTKACYTALCMILLSVSVTSKCLIMSAAAQRQLQPFCSLSAALLQPFCSLFAAFLQPFFQPFCSLFAASSAAFCCPGSCSYMSTSHDIKIKTQLLTMKHLSWCTL